MYDRRGGRKLLPTLLVGLLSTSAAIPYAAAEETAARSAGTSAIGEITVTARKVEERLIDTPVTVTALTAQELEDRNVTQMRQLIQFTPGFFFQASNTGRGDRSVVQLAIRGIVPSGDLDSEQGASVFIDGAPMSGGMLGGLEDAERVEVLRGPQSAYFGRSTFSGAINFVSKTPSNYFKGKVTADVAEWGTTNNGLQIEGPLIKDVLTGRISVNRYHTEGQYKVANNPGQKLGERDTLSGAVSLYFTPTEKFDAKLRLAARNDSDGPSASFAYGFGNGEDKANCRLVGATATLPDMNGTNNFFCGVLPTPTSAEINGDYIVTPRVAQLLANIPDAGYALQLPIKKSIIDHFGLEREVFELGLIWNYDLPLGFTLSSNSAYHRIILQTLDDIDRRANVNLGGSPLTDAVSLHTRNTEDMSQELRLTSPRERRLRGMIGGSYYRLDYDQTTGLIIRGVVRSLGFGALADTKTYGVFGAVEYDIFDNLTIALEGRRQWDHIEKAAPTGANRLGSTFKSFTPRVHIDWKLTPDHLLFASYAEGVKPGTFNPAFAPYPPSFIASLRPENTFSVTVGEEELKQYEVGFKGVFLDGRARIQSAIYYSDWAPQVTLSTGAVTLPNGTVSSFNASANAGEIEMWGAEFEGAIQATENLSLAGTFSWNDSEIISMPCAQCVSLFNSTLTGSRYSAAPEYQASLTATYRKRINDALEGYVRGEFTYATETSSFNENNLRIWTGPAIARTNVRVGLEKGDLVLEGYVTNLFNDDGVQSATFVVDYAYFGVTPTRQMLTGALADKRTAGARISYKF